MGTKIQRSSGDVFRDVGFGEEEAAHLRVRANLMARLSKLIRGMTMVDAGKFLGVKQIHVGNLRRGRIELFSIEQLVDMLSKAGFSVEFVVRADSRRTGEAKQRRSIARTRMSHPAVPQVNLPRPRTVQLVAPNEGGVPGIGLFVETLPAVQLVAPNEGGVPAQATADSYSHGRRAASRRQSSASRDSCK